MNDSEMEKIKNSEQAKKLVDSIRECGVVSELTLDDLDSCSGGVTDPGHTHVWTGKQYMQGTLKNLKCACGERRYELEGSPVDLNTFTAYLDLMKETFKNVLEEDV